MGKPMGFLEYERRPRPEMPPAERIRDYNEFRLPLDREECIRQASRCMDCGIPFCQSGVRFSGTYSGCPLHNLIPEYNDELFHGNWQLAVRRLLKTNNFPEFTGRVCPALCENACVAGINDAPVTTHDIEYAIIEEAFANGWIVPDPPKVRSGKKVAVIGSGPSGLAAADCLNKRGHSVTVYEKEDRPGGLLMYGIPNMKLDKAVIQRRIDIMKEEGIEFLMNADVGNSISASDILNIHDAVILCCGARKPRDIDIPGRDADGICFAVDYLTQATKHLLDGQNNNCLDAGNRNVVVVGGGDTANDCVGTAIRQGCKSIIQLDRNPKVPDTVSSCAWPLKAKVYDPGYGQQEAAALYGSDPRLFSSTVKEIIKDDSGNVKEIVTIQIRKSFDRNGKLRVTQIDGTEQVIPCDMLILAAGFSGCEDYITEAFSASKEPSGTVKTALGKYMTSKAGLFAAGDARRGSSLVVWAIAEGRECAGEVDMYLMEYSNM